MNEETKVLVQKAQKGSPEAFNDLIEKYNRVIYAYCYRRLGNVENAKDATQEIFFRAFYSLKNLLQQDKFLSWLFGLSNNVCCIYAKNNRKIPEAVEANLEKYPEKDCHLDRYHDLTSVEESMDRKQFRERVLEAIGELPENYQLPLMLRYLEEMTYQEIASTLNISQGAVVGILFRGTRYLRVKLKNFLPDLEKDFPHET